MISVIVPSFNEEENIAQCLVSLSHQTLARSEYEILVVDGGSTDKTCEIARKYADKVFVQTSKKVGGARNDGVIASKGDIIASTDADCILPPDWVERVKKDFADPAIVQVYGPVYPIEDTAGNHFSLLLANTFSRIGYYSRTFYYTLGCNTAFRKDAFLRAGMYRCIDAGDDLEIAMRMKDQGKIRFDGKLKVGFSMRRYQQYGTFKSLYEWLYIVAHGGESQKYAYTQKKYNK